MTDLLQLKDLVARFVLGEADLEMFRDQFAAATVDADFNEASELTALVDAVDALLVRRDLGEITDKALESSLIDAIGLTIVTIEAEQVFSGFGTVQYSPNVPSRNTNATLVEA